MVVFNREDWNMVNKIGFLTRFLIFVLLPGLLVPLFLLKPSDSALATTLSKQVDYLVISNSNLANALIPWVNYRTGQGLKIEIVSPDSISKNASGKDMSDKIRSFLMSKYEAWNLKYVMLVGSFDEIPYKPLYPSAYQREESTTDIGKTMSDFFYSDLSSDFDFNKNNYAGEYLLDKEMDFTSEVVIGRIPFDDIYVVSKVISQIIDFEKSSKSKSALLAASILSYKNEEINPESFTQKKTDGASLTEAVNKDLLSPQGYKTQRIY